MPTVRLMARNVPTLKPSPDPARRETYRDTTCPGLYLDVFSSGIRTFGVGYRVRGAGRPGRLPLGRYQRGVYELADAREEAKDALHQARKGEDPAAKKRQDREARTFGDLAAAFLTDAKSKIRESTHEGWARIARHADLTPLAARKPDEIERGDVIRLLDRVAERAPIMANRTFELIRRVFSWGIEKDLVKASPCVGVKKPGKETPRSRFYTNEEVRAILASLGGEGRMGDAVRLVFFTGVRIEQALGARWSELSLDKKEWLIPGARAGVKNGLDWLIPLTDPAIALLQRLQVEAGESVWVFPVRKRKSENTEGPSQRQQRAIYAIRERSGVHDFTPHDIRRTITSWPAANKIQKEVRDAILGHKPGRLEGTYNVYSYLPEKRKALGRWAKHLDRLLMETADVKVLPIVRA